jgi:hypothetical protein
MRLGVPQPQVLARPGVFTIPGLSFVQEQNTDPRVCPPPQGKSGASQPSERQAPLRLSQGRAGL